MDKMAKLESVHNRQNIRFRTVFGCNLEEWDGSLESAEAKLQHMKRVREARKGQPLLPAKPPKPPPPPPPPGAGGAAMSTSV